MSAEGLAAAQEKMRTDGVEQTAIDVFSYYYSQLESGATGIIAEPDIEPLEDPTRLVDLDDDGDAGRAALDATVVIKLNGGLGTSMGMHGPKSLLEVHGGHTFLDVIAGQVLSVRRGLDVRLPLLLMNSFRTRDSSLEALSAYPDLPTGDLPLDFLQNREPKLLEDDLTAVEWPADPSLEWCPPGHGDLYTALWGTGLLQRLLDEGLRYAFVSNGDNLGATADPRLAAWFAGSGAPYAAEVCRRTPADRKGGHLAVRRSDGRLVLRDSAQTAPEDADAFADETRHRYFHCNNLWLDLRMLADELRNRDGVLGLPLIRNSKTVDPADKTTPQVVQIETAMGAAIEVFSGAQAVEVERERFLPVKSTNDLLVLRSDVYELADDFALGLTDGLDSAPYVDLDSDFYKLVDDFDARFPAGPPSLAQARSFVVHGEWTFGSKVTVRGDVTLDEDGAPGRISDGTVLEGH
jgi:UTP--glucose-1-phosphate uridylyltransferase